MGVSPSQPQPLSRATDDEFVMSAAPASGSRFRAWWTFERAADWWVSVLALGVGVIGATIVLIL
jgi:hypothetical protein